jgi:hypothetical protein
VSAGSTPPQTYFSLADLANSGWTTTGSLVSANRTIGTVFVVTHAGVTISGLRFWWVGGGGALTVKCSLWERAPGGTAPSSICNGTTTNRVASGTDAYIATMWENGGTKSSEITGAWPPNNSTMPFQAGGGNPPGPSTLYGPSLVFVRADCWASGAGDVTPNNPGGNGVALDPITTGP